MNEIYILGAGGHGKVVASVLHSAGIPVSGFYDDAPALLQKTVAGLPVLGTLRDFMRLDAPRALIGMGDRQLRTRLSAICIQTRWITAIHAASWVDPTVELGAGSVICAGSIIQPDTIIGNHCIVNTGATVDHDCKLSNFVHICPGVHLGGNVTIGDGSWIGIGAQIIQGVTVGKNVIIGAGSTVLHDVPDNIMAVGSPSRIVRYIC
ncbi:MAG: acetyltransferase [Spartobacteria bacterium]|nr:acetyltransferase [Spartobacteria bacterium]